MSKRAKRAGKKNGTTVARFTRSPRRVVTIITILLVAFIVVLGLLFYDLRSSPMPGLPMAAIIDQHDTYYPNPEFIEQLKGYLEELGFGVDIYRGEGVNVELYRRLPEHRYQLVVFRVHSALRLNKNESNYGTWLFTNESYSETKYVSEQMSNELAKARIEENYPWLFAVGSKFIAKSLKGEFDKTIIVMMGCGPLYIEDMAQAFIHKGASACIGWNERAALDYLDTATLNLVSRLEGQDMTISRAVADVMSEIGADRLYGAELKYYPPEIGDKNIRQLLGWGPK